MKKMKYSLVSFLMMIVILSFSLNVLGKEKVEGYKYFKFGKSYDQIKEDAKENGDRCNKKTIIVEQTMRGMCQFGGTEIYIQLRFEDKTTNNLIEIEVPRENILAKKDPELFKRLHKALSKKYGYKGVDSQTSKKVVWSYADGLILLVGDSTWGISIIYKDKVSKEKSKDEDV